MKKRYVFLNKDQKDLLQERIQDIPELASLRDALRVDTDKDGIRLALCPMDTMWQGLRPVNGCLDGYAMCTTCPACMNTVYIRESQVQTGNIVCPVCHKPISWDRPE